MNVKRTGKIAMILMVGYTTLAIGATEDEIMKAMSEISTTTIMKSSAPKIVSESEAMVLLADKPTVKVSKKETSSTTKKRVNKVHKKVYKKASKRVKKAVVMEDLPMAKSYPMSYDVSQITE